MAAYFRPARRLVCSAFAAVSNCGSENRSQALAASVRAARFIPFLAIVVPPQATACQECPGVPGAQQAALNPATGTTQETSPTSVDPPPERPDMSKTRVISSNGGAFSGNDSCKRAANCASSDVYCRSFKPIRFA